MNNNLKEQQISRNYNHKRLVKLADQYGFELVDVATNTTGTSYVFQESDEFTFPGQEKIKVTLDTRSSNKPVYVDNIPIRGTSFKNRNGILLGSFTCEEVSLLYSTMELAVEFAEKLLELHEKGLV